MDSIRNFGSVRRPIRCSYCYTFLCSGSVALLASYCLPYSCPFGRLYCGALLASYCLPYSCPFGRLYCGALLASYRLPFCCPFCLSDGAADTCIYRSCFSFV